MFALEGLMIVWWKLFDLEFELETIKNYSILL